MHGSPLAHVTGAQETEGPLPRRKQSIGTHSLSRVASARSVWRRRETCGVRRRGSRGMVGGAHLVPVFVYLHGANLGHEMDGDER